jgi:hypothetical protein
MKTKKQTDTRLKRAKERYFKLEKELKKAREELSRAYSEYDDRGRYDHMVEKYRI